MEFRDTHSNGSVPQWDISAKHGRERSAEVHQKLTTSLSTKEVYLRKIRI